MNTALPGVEPTRTSTRPFWSLVCPLLLAACAHTAPVEAPRATPHPVATVASQPPVHDVPAQSTFSVSLLNPVGTRLSSPGDAFRAKVISPLMTLRGYPLVPVGSVLRGRVVSVEQAPTSRLRLKFETLTTTAGPVPLYATLAGVQPDPSFVVRQGSAAQGDYDVTLDGVPALPVGRSAVAVRSHSDIRLGAKTQLDVVLVHPIRVVRN